jgi:hypothetical protein
MSVYWITFRIHDATVNGETYDARYDSLTNTVKIMGMRWDIPTSYAVFESGKSLDDVLAALTTNLSEQYDVLMIGEVGVKNTRIWGNNPDDDIFKLMPYLKNA